MDKDNEFMVLDAQRYSMRDARNADLPNEDLLVVLLKWYCVKFKQPHELCKADANEFVLYDKSQGRKIKPITFPQHYVVFFGIDIPENIEACCSVLNNEDNRKVYLLFEVPCFQDLVLTHPSEYDYLYYMKLPKNVQCKRR